MKIPRTFIARILGANYSALSWLTFCNTLKNRSITYVLSVIDRSTSNRKKWQQKDNDRKYHKFEKCAKEEFQLT